MLTLKVGLLCLVGLANWLVALLALARNVRKLNYQAFFILTLSMGGWALGISGFLLTTQPSGALLWAKVYYLCPMLLAAALMYFVFSFPDKTFRKIPAAVHIFTLAGLLINIVPLLTQSHYLTNAIAYHDWGKQVLLGARAYGVYSAYLLICFVVAIGYMLLQTNRLRGFYANQARLFVHGFWISAVFGLTFNLVLPGFNNYQLIWIGPSLTTILVVAIGISIIRHKMFDVRLAVARTLGYALSLLIITALYGVIAFGVVNRLLGLHISAGAQASYIIITAVFALFFRPLKQLLDKATNAIFYRDAYDPQAVLDHLNRALVASIDMQPLVSQSADIIRSALKVDYAAISLVAPDGSRRTFVAPAAHHLSDADIRTLHELAAAVPAKTIVADSLDGARAGELKEFMLLHTVAAGVRLNQGTRGAAAEGLGTIVLGNKRSGNTYTHQDVQLLETIANELIIAIQNALHYEEIQQFNARLQARVDEATRKLRHSNDKLRELDEAKDDFVSMASHQLRTPLTSVKGYLSLVLDGDAGKISASQRELLSQAFASSQRMVYLIADLLNVSRLKTGKFVIENSPVNLAEVAAEEIGQLQDLARTKNQTLAFERPAHFPDLLLDDTKIRQVIMNFTDNALHYTPAGGQITVSLSETPASVEFRVTDNGIGVPRAEVPHLFTKFYRAGNARKLRPDGTGLGLFMAKKVIVAQGGSVIFDTEEDKGSTFGFIFPKSSAASTARD